MSNIADPHSWEVLSFGDKDAFVDFLGQHALWHIQIDAVVRKQGGAAYATLPLGDGPSDEEGDWHNAHQAVHDGEAKGLKLQTGPDLTSYDLNDRDEFASWTWSHAAEHVRLRVGAGI